MNETIEAGNVTSTTPTLVIALPFPGFYESSITGGIDHAESCEAQSLVGRDEQEADEGLELDENTYLELLIDNADYKAMHNAIAAEYVDAFGNYVCEMFDVMLSLSFEEVKSPREYNFRTDSLFARIPEETVVNMFEGIDREHLAAVIKERHQHRSGFVSFYSDDAEDWFEKDVKEWDHNELETLLTAFLTGLQPTGRRKLDLQGLATEVADKIDYSTFLDNHVDWKKFEAMVEDKRDEKRKELDPGFIPRPKPCKHTPDLFGDKNA